MEGLVPQPGPTLAPQTLAGIQWGEYSTRPGEYPLFGLTYVGAGTQHFGITRPQPNLAYNSFQPKSERHLLHRTPE